MYIFFSRNILFLFRNGKISIYWLQENIDYLTSNIFYSAACIHGKTSFIMTCTLVTINVVISLRPMALDLGILKHLCWASQKEIPKKVSHLLIILTNA